MRLQERLQLWTTFVVVLTTVLVGAASVWWGVRPGVVAVQAGAGVAALVVAHLGMRGLTVPLIREAAHLESQLRRLASDPQAAEAEPLARTSADLSPLQDAITALIASAREREDDLRAQSVLFTEVIERSAVGVLVTDADGYIAYLNPSMRSMFRTRGEPVGRTSVETFPIIELHEAVEAAREGQGVELAASTGDGDFVLTSQALDDGRVVVRVEDVTEAREVERARTDFVANVSHELRTPVTALMGYSETLLLDADRLPPDVRPLLETIERNARRLRDLFEDLLKLHRIEVRRRELPLRPLALAPVLAEATGGAADLAQRREVAFSLDCPADLVGLGNPEALVAIVGNLATNAVRYTPAGGTVRVAARATGDTVTIDVVDDGIGIPERHHERIWERFYRVDDARTRQVGGTGLGLAIVKHFALACRCQLELESAEGKGSRFSVILPPMSAHMP